MKCGARARVSLQCDPPSAEPRWLCERCSAASLEPLVAPAVLTDLLLIVEDDVQIRETIGELLRDEGYRTIEAANGQQALELLRGAKARPRVVLVDLMMPIMNGWEFLERADREGLLESTSVVVMTAQGDDAILPPYRVLRKPLTLEGLLEAVEPTKAPARG